MLVAAILIFAHCSLTTAAEAIVLGDERTDEYMPLLDGKRIALFANHSGRIIVKKAELFQQIRIRRETGDRHEKTNYRIVYFFINGNVLTGKPCTIDDYVGAHTSEITVIPEGNDADEMLGWILPRFKQFSVNRSYFSWLLGKKEYALDARVKGGERHMIMSGEYDKVLPMDIYAEYLIKAIIAGDIDKMEQLGIYEVAPEDFALAEFVDSSKLELQKIVREGLDMLRKENA